MGCKWNEARQTEQGLRYPPSSTEATWAQAWPLGPGKGTCEKGSVKEGRAPEQFC